MSHEQQETSYEQETTLAVQGMTCPSCIRHVKYALASVEGVTDVEINFAERKVTVKHQSDWAPVEALVGALDEAGYPAKAVTT